MKKFKNKRNLLFSALSAIVLGTFILLAVSSTPLDNLFLHQFLMTYDFRPVEDKWEYTETIDFENGHMFVTSGFKDKHGRWHGTIYRDIYTEIGGTLYLYSQKIPSRYGKEHGLKEVSFYRDGEFIAKRFTVWRDGKLIIETSTSTKRSSVAAEHSTYEAYILRNLENTAMLLIAGYDSLYISDFFAALEEELYAESFGSEEFDEHYEAVLETLSATPYDSIINDSEAITWLNALEIAKDHPFRLAVIDQILEDVEQSIEVLQSRYSGFVDILKEEGISESDLSEFCRQFDSCMTSYGSLDMDDPYLVDSIDIRVYSAILTLYNSGEDEILKRAMDLNLARIPGMRYMRRQVASVLTEEIESAEVPEVAELILYTIFMAFLEGDKMKESVWETWVMNTGTHVLPQVATGDVNGITATSMSVQGYVIFDGGEDPIEHGVVWGESYDPTIEGNKARNGASADSFQIVIDGLEEGKTYYTRAYATNSQGTAYGSSISIVATKEASDLDPHKAGQMDLIIYPNPASEDIHLSFNLEREAWMSVIIYAMDGREVISREMGRSIAGSKQLKMDISSLEEGSYICRITDRDIVLASSKLVIAR